MIQYELSLQICCHSCIQQIRLQAEEYEGRTGAAEMARIEVGVGGC